MSRHRARNSSTSGATSGGSALLSASVVMAVGTVVSRVTGFMRSALIAVSLGLALNGDVYTLANTIPTSVYILVAGGIFNVVLVPQLVRAMKRDDDGGEAYANRIITLGLLVLGITTVILIAVTPLLARVIFDAQLFEPQFAAERQSAYNLMRYCLPQVFFYGAFVLCGQILNARGRFGPMMWAPIANNVLSCAILFGYIALYGTAGPNEAGGFTRNQELILGVGSTLGIALQALVLLPYLYKTGFRFRARFDFRGVGLGHTLRLGVWTLYFVLVNQVVFIVVNRIASSSSTAAKTGDEQAAGATVYQIAFLISQVPHGIITVSVLTATIPLLSSLAADRELPRMRAELTSAMRVVLSAIVPIAVVVACLGQSIATIMASYGSLQGSTGVIGDAMMAFAPGIVLFSLHYMILRGFYADEDTRTPFYIQICLAVAHITLAITLTSLADIDQIAMFLALAYGGAYFVGVAVSSTMLSRRIGRIFDRAMLGYLGRLLLASAAAGAVMLAASYAFDRFDFDRASVLQAAGLLVLGGGAGAVVYVVAAKLLRLTEVSALLRAVTRRG